jgi:hypothetical protein
MIEWTPLDDFEERLRRYPPIGLRLRTWFQARCELDPTTTLRRIPETREDEGLGTMSVWSGFIDTVPFALRSIAHLPSQFGLEVAFPVRLDGDRFLLDALKKLALPAWRQPYFEPLPIVGGFGVVKIGDDTSIYTSRVREDAVAIAAFVNMTKPNQFAVVPIGPIRSGWIVIGPIAGPYISWLETMSSEEAAKRQAAKWAADTGASFEVRRHL